MEGTPPCGVRLPDPQWFRMMHPSDPDYAIGIGKEVTNSGDMPNANLFEFKGGKADVVHRHNFATEIYWIQPDSGPVEFWLDGERFLARAGERFIIRPGCWHATRPSTQDPTHIILVAAPAFSAEDQEFMDPQPEGWLST